jgi:hypothetical protein
MLDNSIRGSLAPFISPGFYGWISRGGEGGSSSIPNRPILNQRPMLSCSRESFSSSRQREFGGMLDHSIRGSLTPFISSGFYGWISRGGEGGSSSIPNRPILNQRPMLSCSRESFSSSRQREFGELGLQANAIFLFGWWSTIGVGLRTSLQRGVWTTLSNAHSVIGETINHLLVSRLC